MITLPTEEELIEGLLSSDRMFKLYVIRQLEEIKALFAVQRAGVQRQIDEATAAILETNNALKNAIK